MNKVKLSLWRAMLSVSVFAIGTLFLFGGANIKVAQAEDVEVDLEFQVNDETDGVQSNSQAVLLENENIFVVWVSRDGENAQIKGKIINKEGETIKEEFEISENVLEKKKSTPLQDNAPYDRLYSDELQIGIKSGKIIVLWESGKEWTHGNPYHYEKYGQIKIFNIKGDMLNYDVKFYDDSSRGYGRLAFNTKAIILDNGNILLNRSANYSSKSAYGYSMARKICIINIENTLNSGNCLKEINANLSHYGRSGYKVFGIKESFLSNGRILLHWEYSSEYEVKYNYEEGMIIDLDGRVVKEEFKLNMSEYEDDIVDAPVGAGQKVTLANGTVFEVADVEDEIMGTITGILKDECVESKFSTNSDWGWNWAKEDACELAGNEDNEDEDNNDEEDNDELVCYDYDGDGWGWDGEKGCRVEDNDNEDEDAGEDEDILECTDWDGDGWGWDGEKGCKVESEDEDEDETLVCYDWDGDGWGWDGEKGCRVSDNENGDDNEDEDILECIDWDGDGWGWDGEKGCRVSS
jgi:hypothetical protein